MIIRQNIQAFYWKIKGFHLKSYPLKNIYLDLSQDPRHKFSSFL